jgi:hypothetical protein
MFARTLARKFSIILLVMVGLTNSLLVHAEDNPRLPIAGIQNGFLRIFNVDAEPKTISEVDANWIFNIAWSDNGQYLAYTHFEPDSSQLTLMVTDGVNAPVEMASGLEVAFPVSFLPGSNDILYTVSTKEYRDVPNNPSQEVVKVYSIAPGVGTKPTQLGTILVGVGCGGGSPYPADWAYTQEAGGLRGNRLLLAMTPFGLVHSTNCGGAGTALTDLKTGESALLGGEQLARVVLSPDRTLLAGISLGEMKIYVINLQTRQASVVASAADPDQLAWGDDGDLFYSTRTAAGSIALSANDQQKFNTTMGYDAKIETVKVSIHRINRADNSDTALYQADAWAIGRMFAISGGNNALVFSQIPNMEGWVKGIVDGSIDPAIATNDEQLKTVEPQLFRLDLTSGKAEPIATGIHQATLNASMYRP